MVKREGTYLWSPAEGASPFMNFLTLGNVYLKLVYLYFKPYLYLKVLGKL